MRLALLASVTFLSALSLAYAQNADRITQDRDMPGASRQMGDDMKKDRGGLGGERERHGAGNVKEDRAEGAPRDREMREEPRHRERADRIDERSDHVGGHDVTLERGQRDRKEVIDRDRVGPRERVETSTRRHLSIAPERRTHYRDAFVKTYKDQPSEGVDVHVGARLPERVIVEHVPESYYVEEPDLRGLSYFVDRGHAYLVDPDSREVIDDLD